MDDHGGSDIQMGESAPAGSMIPEVAADPWHPVPVNTMGTWRTDALTDVQETLADGSVSWVPVPSNRLPISTAQSELAPPSVPTVTSATGEAAAQGVKALQYLSQGRAELWITLCLHPGTTASERVRE